MYIKKNIFLFLLLSNFIVFAQTENKSQSIELPAFVITGIQSVAVPTMDKKKSKFIHVVGKNFLTPNYDTEDFPLLDSSNPRKREMQLNNLVDRYNGLLQLGAGLQTLPIGNLYFGLNKSNILFTSHLFGRETRNYVPNSGYNVSGAKVKLNYFVNHKASAFAGLSFGVEGNFLRDKYYFYGNSNSVTTVDSRENEFFNGKFFISNQINRNFQYAANFSSNILNMKLDGIFENIISAEGSIEKKFIAVSIGGGGSYKVQKINNNILGYKRADYFNANGYVKFTNSKKFELKIGADYSQLDTNKLLSPKVVLSVFVEEGVALFISYGGGSKFVTRTTLMNENRYFQNGISNIFQKTKSDFRVAIKYDFSDVFEVNAGFHSASYDNYHYYEDIDNNNKFDVLLSNDVKKMGGFLNIKINAKKYGELFANLEFQNVTDTSGSKLPYNPMLMGNLSYAYHFKFGLYSKLKMNFSRFTYTNLSNSASIPSYVNLELLVKYSLFNSLAVTCNLQNLLNKKYFLFEGYQAKPLDVIVGIEYRW